MNCEKIYGVFSHMPTLETTRLVLRPMHVGDCFDMFEYAKRPEVTEFLSWNPHGDVEYTKEYLHFVVNHYRLGDFYDWAIVWKETNTMIGTCGFTRFRFEHDAGEIGYVVNPDYRGRGIAAEAAGEVLKFGFLKLGLQRIEAKFILGNDASRRVMEKLGMRFEGVAYHSMKIRGAYRDIGTSAILREEYLRLRN